MGDGWSRHTQLKKLKQIMDTNKGITPECLHFSQLGIWPNIANSKPIGSLLYVVHKELK